MWTTQAKRFAGRYCDMYIPVRIKIIYVLLIRQMQIKELLDGLGFLTAAWHSQAGAMNQ